MAQCNGKQHCKVTLDKSLYAAPALLQNFEQFVFVQVGCEQDKEMLHLKSMLGLASAVIGLAICLVFHTEIKYMRAINLIAEKELDRQIITVGDFTIEGKVTTAQFQRFMQTRPAAASLESTDEGFILPFERYLAREIERWVHQKDMNESSAEMFRVADL